jgi:hypothetical protein
MDEEFSKIWKKVVVTCVKVFSYDLNGVSRRNMKRQSVSRNRTDWRGRDFRLR